MTHFQFNIYILCIQILSIDTYTYIYIWTTGNFGIKQDLLEPAPFTSEPSRIHGLCLPLPTMVERGAEVTDGKELESPEDVLCVARTTPLSPWGQGIHPDVERAQV